MKTMSHVQKMRIAAQANKQAIQKLLGWDDLVYGQFQENVGRQYLRTVICPDGYGVRELGDSRIFWRWWINLWNRRDEIFLMDDWMKGEREMFGEEAAYRGFHSVANLTSHYPHRVALERSFSVMIGELLDNK